MLTPENETLSCRDMDPKINQEIKDHKDSDEKFNAEELISRLYPSIVRVFDVYEIQNSGEALYFYGTPIIDSENVEGELWAPFHQFGFRCILKHELGEYFLLVTPEKKAKEETWINLVLFIVTFFTTMICGAWMFGVNLGNEPMQLFRGLPFSLAIMAILGSHEMAHYIMARHHGMEASLPYFIPFPAFIGTMGAIIRYKGSVPSRKALFDVGIAGPLAGLLMSVAVTFVGFNLKLPAVQPLQDSLMFDLGLPPLFVFIQTLVGATGENLHPVAFAGWIGMLVTLLNLLPAGQLDGGHILRAMLGKRAERVSFLMPRILLLVGLYVIYWLKEDGLIWIFWALFLWAFASIGHPSPLHDKVELDRKRILLGIVMFILGLLCFTLIPFKSMV
jgi:membrane-associated protease RseP (regulator of RpoE activity)